MSEFQQLVDDHYQGLYRFALSLSKNRDIASDLVQETFCIWAAKGNTLRDQSKAKSWLFTTLHREFLSHRRKASRFSDAEVDEERAAEETEDASDRKMDAQRALDLLHGLDELYRAPLALFYLQQNSYKEIAAILDVPIGTVMSRLARGKEMLRKAMLAEPSSAPKNILLIQEDRKGVSHG